jgi:hypothetical protein
MEIMGENSLRSSRVLGNNDVIIIVTGLPRSGTSMMMAMLRACGIPLLTDGERVANQDNPKGYFEYEQVKNLNDGDYKWLSKAKGKAVKVISYLLLKLPGTFRYRVIFIHRKLDEILLVRHLQQVEEWIENQSNIDRINVDYNRMLENPDEDIQRLSSFLGNSINIESLRDVIDPKLYRQRF